MAVGDDAERVADVERAQVGLHGAPGARVLDGVDEPRDRAGMAATMQAAAAPPSSVRVRVVATPAPRIASSAAAGSR